ncbi:MAG: pyridoxal phosphate-dependent aminotransferase [Gammaproteobacteria bacterium]|nr:pyridoxal phosphate-dependent aminotransferase [Gammaproteobacteria bacterium]
MLPHSSRTDAIHAFQVMRLLARARELEQQGRDIVHMEIGEPDFPTPEPVVKAAQAAIATGHMHYTPATGLPALKQAIVQFYRDRYGVTLEPNRIVITPGASGALLLAIAAVAETNKTILVSDPGYPCNRNFVRFLAGRTKSIPVDSTSAYQITLQHLQTHWDEDTVGVVLASPSNPTGTLIPPEQMQAIIQFVRDRNGIIFMDEIYHGLVYTDNAETILKYTDDAFVINSFSKYFGMTGWRLGWLVAPEEYVTAIDNFAQNIFLAAPTPSQHAALAAFAPENIAILESRRIEFQRRRDYLLPALRELGFKITVEPQGAFYIYCDCSHFTQDSMQFVEDLLEQIGVAITPGADFGDYKASTHVRVAYTTSLERLVEGVERLKEFLR